MKHRHVRITYVTSLLPSRVATYATSQTTRMTIVQYACKPFDIHFDIVAGLRLRAFRRRTSRRRSRCSQRQRHVRRLRTSRRVFRCARRMSALGATPRARMSVMLGMGMGMGMGMGICMGVVVSTRRRRSSTTRSLSCPWHTGHLEIAANDPPVHVTS